MKTFTKVALVMTWLILAGPFLAFSGFIVWHAPSPWNFVSGAALLAVVTGMVIDCRNTWNSVSGWLD